MKNPNFVFLTFNNNHLFQDFTVAYVVTNPYFPGLARKKVALSRRLATLISFRCIILHCEIGHQGSIIWAPWKNVWFCIYFNYKNIDPIEIFKIISKNYIFNSSKETLSNFELSLIICSQFEIFSYTFLNQTGHTSALPI